MNKKIAVIMGSDSDFEVMKGIIPVLREGGVDYEFRVISAHRTPSIASEFAQNVKTDGYDLIIAGAGMSAHLPGVLAAYTGVPVIGVPIKSDSSGMGGMDALHSIIQMPPGIPVATVGIDHAEGAAKLAVKMINCYNKTDSNSLSKPVARIAHDREEASGANVEKTVKVLDIYGISYILADLSNGLDLRDNNTFSIINLTNTDIEKIAKNDELAKDIVIVEIPQKVSSGSLNDTSDNIYSRTQNSESAAFVGVNSYQNAAHMVARIAGIHDSSMYGKVVSEHAKLAAAVIEKDTKIRGEVNSGKM